MNKEYFTTKSKTYAYAIQYVTNLSFYKFNDDIGNVIYSFKINDMFYDKLKRLNNIKF